MGVGFFSNGPKPSSTICNMHEHISSDRVIPCNSLQGNNFARSRGITLYTNMHKLHDLFWEWNDYYEAFCHQVMR